jgi:hypothetical protein
VKSIRVISAVSSGIVFARHVEKYEHLVKLDKKSLDIFPAS